MDIWVKALAQVPLSVLHWNRRFRGRSLGGKVGCLQQRPRDCLQGDPMSFRINFALLPMVAVLLPLPAANAAKCTDIPLRITLLETATLMNLDGTAAGGTVASAVVGDGNDVYTDGQTTGATIKFCSNTYDAVLNLLVGKRKLTAILPAAIPGSGVTANTPPPGSYTRNG